MSFFVTSSQISLQHLPTSSTTPEEKTWFHLETIESLDPKKLLPISPKQLQEMLNVISSKINVKNGNRERNGDYLKFFKILTLLSQLAQQHPDFKLNESMNLFKDCLTVLMNKGFDIHAPFRWTNTTPIHQSITLESKALTMALLALGAVPDRESLVPLTEGDLEKKQSIIPSEVGTAMHLPFNQDVIKIVIGNRAIRVMNEKRIKTMETLEQAVIKGNHIVITGLLKEEVLRHNDLDRLCRMVLQQISTRMIISEQRENDFSEWALAVIFFNDRFLTLYALNKMGPVYLKNGTLDFCLKNRHLMQVNLGQILDLQKMARELRNTIEEVIKLKEVKWVDIVLGSHDWLMHCQDVLIKSAEIRNF